MKIIAILLTVFSLNAYATPVNINKADAKTIAQSLHGIGINKAKEIIKYRKQNGAFKTVKDLIKVKGIGEKTLKKNKSDILFTKVKGKKVKKKKKAKKSS